MSVTRYRLTRHRKEKITTRKDRQLLPLNSAEGQVAEYGMARRVPLHTEAKTSLVALKREAGAFARSRPVVPSQRMAITRVLRCR